MKIMGVRFWIVVFPLLSFAFRAAGQEGGVRKLAEMKTQFEELLADADRAQVQFDAKYEGELGKLSEAATKAANLDLVIAIREEKEDFRSGTKPSPHAALARLQGIYAKETARLRQARSGVLRGLVAGYEKGLSDLKVALTKEGKIDEALAVQAELEVVAAMKGREIEVAASGGVSGKGVPLDKLVAEARCEIKSTAEGVELSSPEKDFTWAATPEKYELPVKFTVVAKTDSTNIRMSFGSAGLIFNWEMNRNQLRFRDRDRPKGMGINGQGGVTPGEWHTFEWTIKEDEIAISVDGEERFRREVDFRGMEEPFRIGPAHGSKVGVKSIEVEELK